MHPARQRNVKWNASLLQAVNPHVASAAIVDRCGTIRVTSEEQSPWLEAGS